VVSRQRHVLIDSGRRRGFGRRDCLGRRRDRIWLDDRVGSRHWLGPAADTGGDRHLGGNAASYSALGLGINQGRDLSDHVFLNRCGRPLTRFGIHALVARCVARTTKDVPSLATKRVSPHTIRHTTATHLLRSGVDINTIRAWLGHVSLETTNVYAEVDLGMKAKALATCEIMEEKPKKPWHQDKGLMQFLKSL
jgi:integrase